MRISVNEGDPIRTLKDIIHAAGIEILECRGVGRDDLARGDKFGAHLSFSGENEVPLVAEMQENRALRGIGFLGDETG